MLTTNSSCCLGNCVFSRLTLTWPWRWAPFSLREANSAIVTDFHLFSWNSEGRCGCGGYLWVRPGGPVPCFTNLFWKSWQKLENWCQHHSPHPLATSQWSSPFFLLNLPFNRKNLSLVLKKKRQKEGQFLYTTLASHIPQNCFFKLKDQLLHELECAPSSHKQLSRGAEKNPN